MPRTINPNQQYEKDGKPIVNGYLWYGVANQDPKLNPIVIYSDEELTVPITNPQRTDAQGRSQMPVYVAESEYSFLVEDENQVQQFLESDISPLNVPGLISADIDMNGFKHINVGDATANNQYLAYGQAQKMYPQVVYTNGASTRNAISVDLPIQPDALVDGQQVIVGILHNGNNIGNPTFKFGVEPAITVYRDNDDTLDNDDTGGQDYFCHFIYNQVLGKWNLHNPRSASALLANTVGNAQLQSEAVTFDKIAVNTITADRIAANAVGQSEISANAVHVSEIDFSIDTDTFSIVQAPVGDSLAIDDRIIADGSSHACFPRTGITVLGGNSGRGWFAMTATGGSTKSLATRAALVAGFQGAGGGSVGYNYAGDLTCEYVSSSKPYNLGHGDMPMMPYLRVNAEGKVTGTAFRESPPWVYAGPTNTETHEKRVIINENGQKVGFKKFAKTIKNRVPPPWEGGNLQEWLEQKEELVEVTQELKHADMHLIPHPFETMEEGDQIVLVDPCSSLVDQLFELHRRKEIVGNLFHYGYLELADEVSGFNAPPGVKVMSARWKNTGG